MDGHLMKELGLYPEGTGESWKGCEQRDVHISALGLGGLALMPTFAHACSSLSLEPTFCSPLFCLISVPPTGFRLGIPFSRKSSSTPQAESRRFPSPLDFPLLAQTTLPVPGRAQEGPP